MKEEELSELSDQDLLDKAKKMKATPVLDAVLVGFCLGIIIYSAVNNSLGFLTLIPLFFVYKLIKKSKNNEALEKILKERNLK